MPFRGKTFLFVPEIDLLVAELNNVNIWMFISGSMARYTCTLFSSSSLAALILPFVVYSRVDNIRIVSIGFLLKLLKSL